MGLHSSRRGPQRALNRHPFRCSIPERQTGAAAGDLPRELADLKPADLDDITRDLDQAGHVLGVVPSVVFLAESVEATVLGEVPMAAYLDTCAWLDEHGDE